MSVLLGVLGAVFGSLLGIGIGQVMGDLVGSIIGAPIGMVAGTVVGVKAAWKFRGEGSQREHDEGRSISQVAALTARLQVLEDEVGRLRIEVRRLQASNAAPEVMPTAAEQAVAPAAEGAKPPPPEKAAFVPRRFQSGAEWRSRWPAAIQQAAPPSDPAPEIPAELLAALPDDAPKRAAFSLDDLAEQRRLSAEADVVIDTSGSLPPPPGPASLTLLERMSPTVKAWVFGGNTIVKAGVVILFLGLAFLLRYAAERVTVPVELQYAGVALIGAVLLGLGWRLRTRTDAAGGIGYGLVLQGAGIGVFYLTVLAAMKLHALLPPAAAIMLMAVIAVLAAVLAVMQNAQWLALVAMAEGFAAPVLISTGGGNHIALFSYLAILDIGIFLMAWHKAWRPLNLIGATATFALAAGWARGNYNDAFYAGTQAFLIFFFALFTVIGVIFARRALALGAAPEPGSALSERALDALRQVGRVDSTLAFGLPLAAFGLQYLLVKDRAYGPAWSALGFALFYLVIGAGLLRRGAERFALLGEAYVILSAIFLTLTIPLALEGSWTGATWAVEAAGMYWLGMRQHRPYARAVALLVLLAGAVQVAITLGTDFMPDRPLVTGSLIGVLLLAGSVAAILRVQATAPAAERPAWESHSAQVLPAIAAASSLLLAWMVLTPRWANVASAWLGLACFARPPGMARSMQRACTAACYAVALSGLAATLHAGADPAQLAGGWAALLATVLIGMALLGAAVFGWHAQSRALAASSSAPVWAVPQDVALLIGIAVIALAMLYAMPLQQAVSFWPWIGLGLLLVALRTAHPALAWAWGVLQVAAAMIGHAVNPPVWSLEDSSALWLSLGLALGGVLAADALQRHLRNATRWPSAWAGSRVLQWAALAWALMWWGQCLPPELLRWLSATHRPGYWPAGLAGWVGLSSLGMTFIARWRGWVALGQATAATVPGWIVVVLVCGPLATGHAPSAHAGWLPWPLALAWHGLLIRKQREWLGARPMQALHLLGFWLFLLLAAREVQLALAGLGAQDSAWSTLGFMLVPALVLGLSSRQTLWQRWPLNEHRDTYLLGGCAPLALYLLAWVWRSNFNSGEAAPLPYLPLLNPLELAQVLVVLALLHWVQGLPQTMRGRVPRKLQVSAIGATVFVLATGLVLRACHHYAGVDWNGSALFASTLTQAALSITWAAIGVGLMLAGHRRARRSVWALGALLLGVVVLKLFLIELADHGGLYRIVSFIIVGALLLVVGYFAPVPPRRPAVAAAVTESTP